MAGAVGVRTAGHVGDPDRASAAAPEAPARHPIAGLAGASGAGPDPGRRVDLQTLRPSVRRLRIQSCISSQRRSSGPGSAPLRRDSSWPS